MDIQDPSLAQEDNVIKDNFNIISSMSLGASFMDLKDTELNGPLF